MNNGNGNVKKFNYFGKLKFEGEYKNGNKNGKGKVYDGSILLFEGNFINGKRNGKGRNYYYNGKLEFEGEYLNREKMEK